MALAGYYGDRQETLIGKGFDFVQLTMHNDCNFHISLEEYF